MRVSSKFLGVRFIDLFLACMFLVCSANLRAMEHPERSFSQSVREAAAPVINEVNVHHGNLILDALDTAKKSLATAKSDPDKVSAHVAVSAAYHDVISNPKAVNAYLEANPDKEKFEDLNQAATTHHNQATQFIATLKLKPDAAVEKAGEEINHPSENQIKLRTARRTVQAASKAIWSGFKKLFAVESLKSFFVKKNIKESTEKLENAVATGDHTNVVNKAEGLLAAVNEEKKNMTPDQIKVIHHHRWWI